MKALITGATGATGKDLVKVLLQDPDYTEVVVFVRRTGGWSHPKLTEVLTDFDQPEEVSGYINGDVWFSCLGTTLKTAGSKEQQWHIDYAIPARFAGIAKGNGVPAAILLSAYGASSRSRVFYSRVKGTLEDNLTALSFEQLIIFRPGLLLREHTDRMGERFSAFLLRGLNNIGLLRKFKPLPTLTLAEKMARAPKVIAPGRHVIALNEIEEV